MKIRIKDKRVVEFFKEKIFLTKHFENMLLILLKQDYDHNEGRHQQYLLDGEIIRAMISNTAGSKNKVEDIKYMKMYYQNHQLMQDLLAVGRELKTHNLVEQIKDIKKNYECFFTKQAKGDQSARPPKPKALKKCNHITLFCDGAKSHSFKKKNKIGINVNHKMKYFYVKHEPILKVIESFDHVCNINLNFNNDAVWLNINYDKTPRTLENKGQFSAGLDLGINELVTVFVNNKSDSLLVDGKRFKFYNNSYNRKRAAISQEIDDLKELLKNQPTLCEGLDIQGQIDYLYAYRRFLTRKRDQFFESEFHKISKRMCEYLYLKGVSELVVSSSLGNLKNNGNCTLDKARKQSFIQIPFMKLIHQLKEKAPGYGIQIKDVNESYTSKTSSLTQDIHFIQTKALDKTLTTDDFKGSRVTRGLFKDTVLNQRIHADVNGAKNILELVTKKKECYTLKQMCNPIKLKSDREFLAFVKNSSVG